MTDDELRVMVRQAIGRVQSGAVAAPHLSHQLHQSHPLHLSHFSHQTFTVPSGADADGPCIIEPAVTCNHCGYCKSMGH
ncbi:MAG TPA: hypothetical protein VFU28_22360 [Vicinamibacterales bacterium]|nr:hypothetical protein [Vicinamibacterales bacterium]